MSDGERLGLIIDGIDIFEKWGISVKSRNIGKPNKKKVLESIPWSSEVLDFSNLYGEDNYEERPLQYVLNLIGTKKDRITTRFLETEFDNFIMNKQRVKLVDEAIPGYYFLVDIREGTDFSPLFNFGEMTVNWMAYPFKIKQAREGSKYWDDYTILDYYQESEFTVNGSKTIELMNTGIASVVPLVTCTAPMTVEINGKQFKFTTGTFQSDKLVLRKGKNTLLLTGNGKIDFEFHKEVI